MASVDASEPSWRLWEGQGDVFWVAKMIFCDFEMILGRILGAQMPPKTSPGGKKSWQDFRY